MTVLYAVRIHERMDMNGTRAELMARRLALGIARADLAQRIGVREPTLYRWERGGIVTIPARSMADWQRALDEIEQERKTA